MGTVFIAGAGSGIGRGLAEEHLRRGDLVFATGQHEVKALSSHPQFQFIPVDLYDAELVRNSLRDFVTGRQFDRVILNASVYPEMRDLIDTTLGRLNYVININVWAHKYIIDTILSHSQTKQIVALSATPSYFSQPGMGAFALSKATLNTLMELYALEFPSVHFSAIAPELIQTPTFDAFLKDPNSGRYPAAQRIRDSVILPLDQGVAKLFDAFEKVKRIPSGSFIEMKKLERTDL